MALEALTRGSAMASCYNQRTARLPTDRCATVTPSSVHIQRTAEALHRHCSILASNNSRQESVYDMVPLSKKQSLTKTRISESCRKSSFSERWIEDSICDIVKHIHEAPFLQLLFEPREDSKRDASQGQRVRSTGWGQDRSADEKWNEVKSYVQGASPDGLIYVHHLQDNAVQNRSVNDGSVVDTARDVNEKATDHKRNGKDLWGVLVLGSTIAKSTCYILETTNVTSPFGRCTSFCLTKAESYGTAWLDQVQNSWLLKTDMQHV